MWWSFCASRDKLEINIRKVFSWWCISSNDFYYLCCFVQDSLKWKSLSHVQLFATHGLYIPWNSPGQNTGVGESESEVAQSCLTLCDPMDGSLPGSAVHGIFQARILEWTAISFSRGSSQPRDQTQVSCIADRRFTIWATRQPFPSPVDLPDPGIKLRSPALQVDRNRPLQKPVWHFRQIMKFLVAKYIYILCT